MTKSKNELILETLQELNVLGSGQSASAEDARAVEDRIQPLLDDLSTRRVIYIANVEEIDEAAFDHLVVMLAARCARKFGAARDEAAEQKAESALRTISRIGKGTGQPLRVDHALRHRRRYGAFDQ